MRISSKMMRNFAVIVLGALSLILIIAGCKDDLAPTMGTLQVQLTSSCIGGTDDVTLYLNGNDVTASISDDLLELRLEPGEYTITAVPADSCLTMNPSELTCNVEVGHVCKYGMEVIVAFGLTVTSNIEGAAILIDDAPTGKYTPATINCVSAGPHRVELDVPCFGTESRPGMDIEALPDSAVTVDIISPSLTITSNAPCVDIYFNGESTGYQVGAFLPCVGPGAHTIGLGVEDSILVEAEVEMGTAPKQVVVDIPVVRRTILEVLGWVTCTFCPIADEVTCRLVHDPEFSEHILRVEVHQDLDNLVQDVFGNDDTQFRYDQYPMSAGAPLMVFNGGDYIRGAPAGGAEALFEALAEKARVEIANQETSWLIILKDLEEVQPWSSELNGGEVYRLTACISVVSPLDESIPVLYAFAYKTDIEYTNVHDPDQNLFHDVVRTIRGPLPLKDAPYNMTNVGDAAQIELEFEFPSNEIDHLQAPWPFGGYGIVVFIQTAEDFPDGKIHQAARITWDKE
ncbi:MAG: PEGA domain-containing protein [Candidatus Eisenbacteria bacterium]|nr:PEGA domain-containing protein [Candidatus Eisenbacteria bacterium]MBU1951005.1 PEGA domain-containing protein [Candidatus Eisenbacteria bacterium]